MDERRRFKRRIINNLNKTGFEPDLDSATLKPRPRSTSGLRNEPFATASNPALMMAVRQALKVDGFNNDYGLLRAGDTHSPLKPRASSDEKRARTYSPVK